MKDGIGLGALYLIWTHFLSWGCQWRCTIISLATGQNTCIYNRVYTYIIRIYTCMMYIIYTVCVYWLHIIIYPMKHTKPKLVHSHLYRNTTSPTSWTYSNKQFQMSYSKTFQKQHELNRVNSMNHHWRWLCYQLIHIFSAPILTQKMHL